MNIINEYPPNIRKIHKTISPDSTSRACFTYGQTIYNPSKGYIDECVGLHEATHTLQQDKGGPDKWWSKWLKDVKFRAQQELEAYQHQYRRYCEINKDRNKQVVELHRLATDLSSPMYGRVISYMEARKLIRADF